jgi:hypothetical protein
VLARRRSSGICCTTRQTSGEVSASLNHKLPENGDEGFAVRILRGALLLWCDVFHTACPHPRPRPKGSAPRSPPRSHLPWRCPYTPHVRLKYTRIRIMYVRIRPIYAHIRIIYARVCPYTPHTCPYTRPLVDTAQPLPFSSIHAWRRKEEEGARTN